MSSPTRHRPIDDQFDIEFANQLLTKRTTSIITGRIPTCTNGGVAGCGSTFRLILKGLVTSPTEDTYYQPEGWKAR
ncbi:MAG: hypothetical protein R3C44_05550 [Chloroflexota bacterium]